MKANTLAKMALAKLAQVSSGLAAILHSWNLVCLEITNEGMSSDHGGYPFDSFSLTRLKRTAACGNTHPLRTPAGQ